MLLTAFVSCKKEKKNISYKYTNQLIHESSPYLLQHAHNPVNWYPWNKKYLNKAKKENKLVLLSIGYSSCHWCHVMEKETFENEEVAKFMNDHFINIKIDREEHPDVDKTYMTAVQIMTGNGGWPLNCIILPNGKPVWGGTYFNKENWLNSLRNIHEIYSENPKQAAKFAEELTKNLQSLQKITNNQQEVSFTPEHLDKIISNWKKQLDTVNGGMVGKNQFPRPNSYQFLMRYAFQKKDTSLHKFIIKTLDKIADGGINDHIEGGFARYTVDNKWHVPHFEKMLYDNAQLISLFSYAYQITKNEKYKNTVYNTLNFIDNSLYKNGLYYSSLNADSYNDKKVLEEGAYYTWTKEELKLLFKNNDYTLFCDYYGINKIKTVEDKHVLVKIYKDSSFIKKHKISLNELSIKIKSWKSNLLKERKKRIKPELDHKILTSWNALMLQAFTDAYKVFGDEKLKEKAIENGITLKEQAILKNWKVSRSINSESKNIEGTVEDYALLINSYISLYQITLNEKWLEYSLKLTESSINIFLDQDKKIFYPSKKENPTIINNPSIEDVVIPSGNSVMSKNLFYLGHYFDNKKYNKLSRKMVHNLLPKIKDYPHIYSNWLNNYLNFSFPYYETVICGENVFQKTKELQSYYIPNHLFSGSNKKSNLPLLQNRFINNQTLIYVCQNKTCKLPTENVHKAISLIK